MASDKYIILYEKEGITYKICRIFFGPDGSYYVRSPYHPAHKTFLGKVTVNYAKDTMDFSFEDLIYSASADDEKALKLTHHTSGLIQFSGGRLRSGAGGFSIQSWPLNTPVRGPAFILTLRDVEKYERAVGRLRGERCVFRHRELTPVSGAYVLHLEGYYLPELWRRFVQTSDDGERSISILHPAGVVLRLKVLFPKPTRHLQGFLGLEMYTDRSEEGLGTYSSACIREGTFLFSAPSCTYRRQWSPPKAPRTRRLTALRRPRTTSRRNLASRERLDPPFQL